MAKFALDNRVLRAGIKELVAAELIDKRVHDLKITPIDAGMVNHNFRIEDGKRRILFKVFENNHILPVDRKTIFSIQTNLSRLDLAPEPLFLSDDKRFYCETWVESASTLLEKKHEMLARDGQSNEKLINDSLIPKLAETLYNVHTTHVGAPLIDLSSHLKAYWENIKRVDENLIKEYEEMLSFCDAYVEQHRGEFVLCHNDLNMDHVCTNSDIIFDWEYASCGCRYYDIASCALINSFDEGQMELLCIAYAQISDQKPQIIIRSVKKVLKLTAFTFKLWHLCMDRE